MMKKKLHGSREQPSGRQQRALEEQYDDVDEQDWSRMCASALQCGDCDHHDACQSGQRMSLRRLESSTLNGLLLFLDWTPDDR